MKQIHKEYERPFLLEPTKLTRLIGKIHERLADHQHLTPHDHFEVFLAGDRRDEMTTIDEVLALENSRKHKIKRLVVVSSASPAGAARTEHEVQVDFAGPKASVRGVINTGTARVVAISVRSDAAGWASRTLSEVEEQVERTWANSQPVLALVGLLLSVLIIFAWQFSIRLEPVVPDLLRMMWLRGEDLDRVEAIVGQQRTITDQEMRDVTTMQLRNILAAARPRQLSQGNHTRQLLLIAIPLAVVVVCIIVLLSTCYPKAVFLWGDEVDRYANMLQRRRILWGVVVGVILVGLLSKFLYEGVAPWLPLE